MTAYELHSLLQYAQPPRLIHVLPPEFFAAERIPGSVNACVYEMTCLDQVKALVPDFVAPIIVYGAGDGSLDAATAMEKLHVAGYTQARAFDGGLAEWRGAGLPLEGDGRLPQPPVPDGTFRPESRRPIPFREKDFFEAGGRFLHRGEGTFHRESRDFGGGNWLGRHGFRADPESGLPINGNW